MALTTWQQSVVAIDVIGPVIFTGLLGMMRYKNKISSPCDSKQMKKTKTVENLH